MYGKVTHLMTKRMNLERKILASRGFQNSNLYTFVKSNVQSKRINANRIFAFLWYL